MEILGRVTKGLMARGLLAHGAVAALAVLFMSQAAHAQYAPQYTYRAEHRRPVDATIRDLQQIAPYNTFSGKESKRFDNAITHLTQFEGRLQSRYFDKGKLDDGIGDVQHILDNNRLDAQARQILNRDVWELRRLRANYDAYRYPY